MALSNYADLKTAILSWMGRPGDTGIPTDDLIALCEAQVGRELRLRSMEARVTSTVDSQYVALPEGFLAMRNFQLNTNPVTSLSLASPEQIDSIHAGSEAGKPRLYAIIGDEIQLAPEPD